MAARTDPPTPDEDRDRAPTPLGRWDRPLSWVGLVAVGVLVALGAVRAVLAGDAGSLVGALVFAAIVGAVTVPLHLMQRSGRGIAAPIGTPESRWSMVAFAGIQAVAAGAGAIWAVGAGRTAFALALGAWALLCVVGVVAALVGPAESMRGLRPGERPRPVAPGAGGPSAGGPGR